MEKIEIPEYYLKPTQNQRNTTTEKSESEDDFAEVPYKPLSDCPVCGGSGFVHRRKRDGSVDYSKIGPCSQPGCYRDQAAAYKKGQILENSGAVSLVQTFDNFDPKVPGVGKAFAAAKKIAEENCNFIWLLIYGGIGSGKTHLLNAIANRVMERGIPAHLIQMADLLSDLRMAMNTNQIDFKMNELKRIPYLLIDELGLEYGTDWEKEKIEELLASRWNRGLRTIIATNRDVSELPPRIKSRFMDRNLSRAILNEAGDYRLKGGHR